MLSEIDKRPYVHECGKTNYIFCPACVYAEGVNAERKRVLAICNECSPRTTAGWLRFCEEIEEGGQDAK